MGLLDGLDGTNSEQQLAALVAIYDLLHDEILPAIASVRTEVAALRSDHATMQAAAASKMEAVRTATTAGACKWRERPGV